MKKEITLIKDIGWTKKEVANWSYRVHLIIDDKGARVYKETFGGDIRMRRKMEEQGYKVNVLSAGGQKELPRYGVRVVEAMRDIEDYNGDNYPQ